MRLGGTGRQSGGLWHPGEELRPGTAGSRGTSGFFSLDWEMGMLRNFSYSGEIEPVAVGEFRQRQTWHHLWPVSFFPAAGVFSLRQLEQSGP